MIFQTLKRREALKWYILLRNLPNFLKSCRWTMEVNGNHFLLVFHTWHTYDYSKERNILIRCILATKWHLKSGHKHSKVGQWKELLKINTSSKLLIFVKGDDVDADASGLITREGLQLSGHGVKPWPCHHLCENFLNLFSKLNGP